MTMIRFDARAPRRALGFVCLFSLVILPASACGKDSPRIAVAAAPVPPVAAEPARAPLTAEQKKEYLDVARLAWKYFESNYYPTTGFVSATPNWPNTSLWDVGGELLATHAAKELGFITPQKFDERMKKVLSTLEAVPLFRNIVFNKLYSTEKPVFGSEGRTGWSATDLGRFLAALRIISAHYPQYTAQINRIVKRSDFTQVAIDGYLNGQLVGSNGQPWTFQEGRIGYEQYAAMGFNSWNIPVANALDFQKNSEPGNVLGVSIPYDTRFNDRLTSEPFILTGLEFGLNPQMRSLATNVLAAQEARYKSTGQMTIASEDAVGVPPDYFYYYCIVCNRKPFVIDLASPGHERDAPRWVSTKASYGWDALMPSDYTKKAVEFVSKARDASKGWSSGIYERTGQSTKTVDINTSAVLLEVALYQLRGGKPLIQNAVVQ